MTDTAEVEGAATPADGIPVGVRSYIAGAFGPLSGDERRSLGRFGGVLMIVGALVSFPAGIALEPKPPLHEHLIGLGSAAFGVLVYFAPWERISRGWLHVPMILGTLEIAAGVAVFSDDYAFFYVLVAMFAAYVIRDHAVAVAYALFIALALLAPLAYANDDINEQVHHILVTLPVLVIAAGIVRYLRDTLEDRERQYRGFAHEAVSLAERIRGSDGSSGTEEDLVARLDRLSSTRAERARDN